MKKLFLLVFAILLSNIPIVRGTDVPDSLLTLDYARSFTNTDPEKAVEIFNEMRRRKLAEPYVIDRTQAYLYYNSRQYMLAAHYLEKVLQYDELKNDPQAMIQPLLTLAGSYECVGRYTEAMETFLYCVEIAKSIDDYSTLGDTYISMGKIAWSQQGRQIAFEYYDISEQYYQKGGNPRDLFWFHHQVAETLYREKEFSDALHYLSNAESYLDQTEQTKEEFCLREEVLDGDKMLFLALAANINHELGEEEKAKEYYEKFMAVPASDNSPEKVLMVPYLIGIGNLDHALENSKYFESFLRNLNDTLSDNMWTALDYLRQVYELSGKADSALTYCLKSQQILQNELENERQNNVIALATIHSVQEKETRIRIAQARLKILSVTVLLCLLLLSVITYLYRRKSAAYKVLARQAKEWAEADHKITDWGNKAGPSPASESAGPVPTQKDREIMEEVERQILNDKIYRELDLSAELLASRLNIHRNTLSKAVNAVTGKNFNRYINEFRVKEAINILSLPDGQNPVMEDLSFRVGFGNRTSFYRAFKQITGLSPAEYRKLIRGQ